MQRRSSMLLGTFAATVLLVSGARGNTVTQNTSWTIDRPGTSTTYRVTAYGDSIYAGYYGSISRVAKRAAPWADGEYLSQLWNADIQVIRRAKSGAVASDIYNNKIVAERSYMQTTNTRVVSFEMCGNDGLQARSNFSGQSGTCDYSVLDTALVLIARNAIAAIDADLVVAAGAVARLAAAHRDDVVMGRTLLQQALPTTFGLKAARWLALAVRQVRSLRECGGRALVLQFGGAAGTLASLGRALRATADPAKAGAVRTAARALSAVARDLARHVH